MIIQCGTELNSGAIVSDGSAAADPWTGSVDVFGESIIAAMAREFAKLFEEAITGRLADELS